nr:ubiquitin carboxyl-terminal hydrolase isozyme l3 [Quercus suber]
MDSSIVESPCRHQSKKIFVPLENNPEVFTDLVHRLGVSQQLGFYDVYSIDEPDLLSLIPRPVHALIFISPADVYHRVRAHDGSKALTYNGSGPDEPIFWCKQTIGHSCGLMALIHSIGNGTAKAFIQPGSLLDRLLQEALPKPPLPRAAVLYDSFELEQAHMASAYKGDSMAPSSAEPNGYHFLSFVPGTDGHLYELDGGWHGPIDRGVLGKDEDGLSEKALENGVRKHVKAAEGSVEFSIVALATRLGDEAYA